MTTEQATPTDLTEITHLIDRVVNPPLWIVTASVGSSNGGLIATFAIKASLVPQYPRFLVGIAKQHHTWKLIESSQAFAIHLVCQDNLDWVELFGFRSGRSGCDKFAGMLTTRAGTGSPVLANAILWMDCRVESSMDTGDRTIYLAEVISAGSARQGEPLRLNRLLELLPAGTRAELDSLLARDIAIDAAAINAWRHARA